jgi:ribosome biogenesis GTPase
LRELLADRTTVLSGQSGVGKSSLLNALDPELRLATRKISQYNSKGTHTTTAARLVRLDFGGHVVDTPGIKELSLWGVGRDAVQSGYPEILKGHADVCRFATVATWSEPGCAVVEAVDDGRISPLRYQNYLSILESL